VKLVGRAAWNPAVNRELGIKPGSRLLVLVIDPDSEAAFSEELKTISRTQHDRYRDALERWNGTPPAERGPAPTYEDGLVDLQLDLHVHYNTRSVDANALYWIVLTLEANFINGTPSYRSGYWSKKLPGHVVTPQEIHDDELETYAETFYFDIPEAEAFVWKRVMQAERGKWLRTEPLKGNSVRMWFRKTTRYMNSKEFNVWTKRKIEAIRDEGSLLKTDVPEFIALKNDFLDLLKGKRKEKTN